MQEKYVRTTIAYPNQSFVFFDVGGTWSHRVETVFGCHPQVVIACILQSAG
jgi:hypothetical protein